MKLIVQGLAAVMIAAIGGMFIGVGEGEAAKLASPSKYNSGVLLTTGKMQANAAKIEIAQEWIGKKALVSVGGGIRDGSISYWRSTKRNTGAINQKLEKLGKPKLKFRAFDQVKETFKFRHSNCNKKVKAKGYVQFGFFTGKVKFKGAGGDFRFSKTYKPNSPLPGVRLLMDRPKCARSFDSTRIDHQATSGVVLTAGDEDTRHLELHKLGTGLTNTEMLAIDQAKYGKTTRMELLYRSSGQRLAYEVGGLGWATVTTGGRYLSADADFTRPGPGPEASATGWMEVEFYRGTKQFVAEGLDYFLYEAPFVPPPDTNSSGPVSGAPFRAPAPMVDYK